jgi:hypothetical protein
MRPPLSLHRLALLRGRRALAQPAFFLAPGLLQLGWVGQGVAFGFSLGSKKIRVPLAASGGLPVSLNLPCPRFTSLEN